MPSHRRLLVLPLLALALLAGCTDGDDEDAAAPEGDPSTSTRPARFCDVFLDYLAEPSTAHLEAVRGAADDPEVDELTGIIATDERTGRVLAADADLQALARERCQPEWVGAAQGGGDTAGAAQAFFDAVVAGDALGARNVASANAIARFEPWEPVAPDADAGTPTLLGIAERSFTMALDPARIAECQVEVGVVITCTLVGGP